MRAARGSTNAIQLQCVFRFLGYATPNQTVKMEVMKLLQLVSQVGIVLFLVLYKHAIQGNEYSHLAKELFSHIANINFY